MSKENPVPCADVFSEFASICKCTKSTGNPNPVELKTYIVLYKLQVLNSKNISFSKSQPHICLRSYFYWKKEKKIGVGMAKKKKIINKKELRVSLGRGKGSLEKTV